jgi:hypothetical protein
MQIQGTLPGAVADIVRAAASRGESPMSVVRRLLLTASTPAVTDPLSDENQALRQEYTVLRRDHDSVLENLGRLAGAYHEMAAAYVALRSTHEATAQAARLAVTDGTLLHNECAKTLTALRAPVVSLVHLADSLNALVDTLAARPGLGADSLPADLAVDGDQVSRSTAARG